MKKKIVAVTLITSTLLVACGGGSSTNTATPLTSSSAAPVASVAAGTDSTGASTGSPTELANSVNVNGYQSLSIAATTTSTLRTASVFDRLGSMLAGLFIKPAYAQTAGRCTTDAYKLVGIKDDGSYEPLSVTTSGTDSCNVGFREMFDLGSYILLTGEGIYKEDQTCNLVFLQKDTGALYCVGETLPSRYRIAASSSSNSCTTPSASMTCSNSEKVQTILDADGVTSKYVLLNAQSTTFDSNNQISGLKTKLLRFDLTDTTNGPKAAVLLEGYQQGWSNYTTASEFEYFNLGNYRIAQNGDVLASYQRSFWSSFTSNASGAYRSNLKYYYNFTNGGSDFNSGNLREEESIPLFNNALASLTANQPTATNVSGTASTQTVSSLSQISCMFDAPNNEGGVLITLPINTWISGYNSVTQTSYSQWGSSSSLFRVTAPTSSSSGKPVISFVKPTLLCSNGSNTGMYYGGDNAPQKIGDTWYTMQSAGAYSYSWNNGSPAYSYNQKTSVIGNSLLATAGNVNDDSVFVIPASSSETSGIYFWGTNTMSASKIRAAKDYLYLLSPGQTSAPSATGTGMEIYRFKPADQTTGSVITNIVKLVDEARKFTITAFTTNKKDNTVDFVARDISSDDIDKVYGNISEAGVYSGTVINNSKYSTVAIVKM